MKVNGEYGVFDPNVAFDALIRTAQYDAIPPEDCRDGYLYWGVGRGLGKVAVCRVGSQFGVEFEGLQNDLGLDQLARGLHYDENVFFGTWRPLVELEPEPKHVNRKALMSWLLEKEISVAEDRLQWLTRLPEKIRNAKSYAYELELTQDELDALLQTRAEGFSDKRTLVVKDILEAARLRRDAEQQSSDALGIPH